MSPRRALASHALLWLAVCALLAMITTVVVLGHISGLYEIPYIRQIEDILYDTRVRLTAPGGVDERIVIVAIDERSLAVPATELFRLLTAKRSGTAPCGTLMVTWEVRVRFEESASSGIVWSVARAVAPNRRISKTEGRGICPIILSFRV